ncbi:PASTA domain-containing protein [Halobacteriovorax vibrionivorans]|uniref:PASTA domain-containing protein n=1 Tax=Halobacteriovorax vibrionivorans TaxID=2152716 RepID=A0ABY0IMM3_9BACT|nr:MULTISPECIES: penicillin-binding protein [Halobacteriovorax]RZF23131.1 PASTA domain-containing protein [Halobacteriovorax vibrionivorans]TGD49237.1 PASTA domain-containing protein [Halobacteriovorax sp. Y22]
MNESNLKNRLKIVYVVFAFAFVAILVKAFRIQVVDRGHLLSQSKKQFFRERKVFPRRGHIYDRNGNPLAINIRTYSLFTIPKNIRDKNVFKKLTQIMPEAEIENIGSKAMKRNRFTWIARKINLTEEQVHAIKKLKGVYIEEIPKRIYPNHELAAQTLGFVGLDNNGLAGIEHRFDDELRGEPQIIKYFKDNKGRPVRYVSQNIPTERSKDIYLSIDKEVQAVAEKAIKEAVEKVEAKRGGVGVMDAETGEIIAVANYPTFDPNDLDGSRSIDRKLSFISDPFEPGSTMKVITVASALENNVVRPDTNYYCEQGRLKVEDHIIKEAESRKKFEWLSVEEILMHSSNIGTTKIAFDLTFPKLKSTLTKFRIGEKTGIELPAESRGIFTDDKNVSPLSLSNISFGQGVATTGIQMLAAFAAISNGGKYVKPTILKVDESNKTEAEQIIPEKVAKSLTDMMIKTVEDGTARNGKIPYFKIAAKTSTAQRADNMGRYTGYIPGFLGFPVGVKKKFVVYAYVDKPAKGKSYYGNSVAGPVFKKVTEYLLYKNKEFEGLAENDLFENDMAFDSVKRVHSAKRYTGRGLVPNFVGLDKKSAMKLARKLDIDLTHSGVGVVDEQLPEPGSAYTKNTIIKLRYAPPTYE